MRDTVHNGQIQSMVLQDGQPKGMKLVLENTKGTNAVKMRGVKFDDLKNEVTILEQHVENKGHMCIFIPGFHCELNAIERCW